MNINTLMTPLTPFSIHLYSDSENGLKGLLDPRSITAYLVPLTERQVRSATLAV